MCLITQIEDGIVNEQDSYIIIRYSIFQRGQKFAEKQK